MLINFKTTIALVGALLFLSGCVNSSAKLSNIKTSSQIKVQNKISLENKNNFNAYINKDNELQYLCYNSDSKKCNYYDKSKHSYKDGVPQEESFIVNETSYYPHIPLYTRDTQCGAGSLAGWLVVFTGIKDFNKINPNVCNSRFTKVDSTQTFTRLVLGSLTFMTPFLTGGIMHTRMFDPDDFEEAIFISNIESFKDDLFTLSSKYNVKGGFDFVYLEEGDIKENLEDKFLTLLSDKSKKEGVVFLEKDTNKLLSINVFNKYKNINSKESISLQIKDLLNNIIKNSQDISFEDKSSIIKELKDNMPLLSKVLSYISKREVPNILK